MTGCFVEAVNVGDRGSLVGRRFDAASGREASDAPPRVVVPPSPPAAPWFPVSSRPHLVARDGTGASLQQNAATRVHGPLVVAAS